MDDVATATKIIQDELNISRDNTCVAGASFGGYAALTMSYKYPDLFECVVGMMGVYDLKMLRNGTDDSVYTQQGDEYFEIMEKYLKGLPQQVGLQLPKLKKVSESPSDSKPSTPPTIKLPKLKKVNAEEAQV